MTSCITPHLIAGAGTRAAAGLNVVPRAVRAARRNLTIDHSLAGNPEASELVFGQIQGHHAFSVSLITPVAWSCPVIAAAKAA